MTTERRNAIILIGLLVLAFAGLTVWWFHTHEQVEEEYRSNPSKEVLQDPFLAARLYLAEVGIEAENSNGLNRFQELPPTTHTILGEHLGVRLPDHRIEELLSWVEQGGHLFTSVMRPWNEDDLSAGDRLLSRLDIYLLRNDFSEQAYDERPWHTVASTELYSGQRLEAQFSPELHLVDTLEKELFSLKSEYGAHLVQIPYGDGFITLTTSFNFIRNPTTYNWQPEREDKSAPYIDDRDHAFLLWYLLNGYNKVWLVQRIKATPLPELFWKNAPYAVVALVVLVLLWIWWQYNRFGPMQGSVIPERRNILEHLLMSTVYAWRQDRAERLFAATRNDIKLLMQRKHPQISALPEPEKISKLAEHCELPAKEIERALHADWGGEREFIELTCLLQRIRKKL